MISNRKTADAIVVNVCTSTSKGTAKRPVAEVTLVSGHGIQGDAHAGKWHRQVSLLAQESHEIMLAKGASVTHGDFGENIVTKGINLTDIPIGTRLKLGRTAIGKVTQIGKKCHARCEIFHTVGDCIMPKQGIFIEIIEDGSLAQNDEIYILEKT